MFLAVVIADIMINTIKWLKSQTALETGRNFETNQAIVWRVHCLVYGLLVVHGCRRCVVDELPDAVAKTSPLTRSDEVASLITCS